MDNAKIFSQLMSKSRRLAKINRRRLQALLHILSLLVNFTLALRINLLD